MRERVQLFIGLLSLGDISRVQFIVMDGEGFV